MSSPTPFLPGRHQSIVVKQLPDGTSIKSTVTTMPDGSRTVIEEKKLTTGRKSISTTQFPPSAASVASQESSALAAPSSASVVPQWISAPAAAAQHSPPFAPVASQEESQTTAAPQSIPLTHVEEGRPVASNGVRQASQEETKPDEQPSCVHRRKKFLVVSLIMLLFASTVGLAIALGIVLASDSDDSESEDDGNNQNVASASQQQTVGSEGGNIELPDIANVTIPEGTFEEDTTVQVKSTLDDAVEGVFEETASVFRAGGVDDIIPYMLSLSSNTPVNDGSEIEVSVKLPEDIPATIGLVDQPEVFVQVENYGENEGPYNIFALLESSWKDDQLTFKLPPHAMIDYGNNVHQAHITVSPTPGVDVDYTNSRRRLSGECGAASIRCPLASCVVTSAFGPRTHFGREVFHWGVDYDSSLGEAVYAVADGFVERSYTSESYGETIVIRHSDQSATLYAHLSVRDVEVGNTVNIGDTIGQAGSTGLSTAPHLHFEYVPNGQIYYSKQRIDPHACVGRLVDGAITVGDNGSDADDSFRVSVDGLVIGTTTIGASNKLSVSNLRPGTHLLKVLVAVAPDGVGTFFIQLHDGLTFASDGSTYVDYETAGSPDEGESRSFAILVPP